MIREEFIIAGGILIVLGIGLCLSGYQDMQPSTIDNIVGFIAQVTETPAPVVEEKSKTQGYIFYGLGASSLLCGLTLILNSRKKRAVSRKKRATKRR